MDTQLPAATIFLGSETEGHRRGASSGTGGLSEDKRLSFQPTLTGRDKEASSLKSKNVPVKSFEVRPFSNSGSDSASSFLHTMEETGSFRPGSIGRDYSILER